MSRSEVIGWDVGGAHLKAARLDKDGSLHRVVQVPCALWQGLDKLQAALDEAVGAVGLAADHAITMTGEMVDLFPNRAAGVHALIDALATRLAPQARLHFYAGDDGFVDAGEAADCAAHIASANWHAAAAFAASRADNALLVDVGSTTTDISVLAAARVLTRAWGDAQRLVEEELIYTGVVRTPLMALASRAPFDGAWVPLMAEHFATTADLYRLTGELPANADQHPAADGGEKSVDGSTRRLARMLGRDAESAPLAQWRQLASWLAQSQAAHIGDACARALSRGLLDETAPLLGAGVGRFLVARIAQRLGRPYRDFAELLPGATAGADWASACAPAVAVAWLLHGSAD